MKKRPEVLNGRTLKAKTLCGSLFLTLNEDEGELTEVRINLGKSGNCVRGLLELIGILYSIILQSDIPQEAKIKALKKHALGINCGNPFSINGTSYTSCIDWIGQKCIEMLTKKN